MTGVNALSNVYFCKTRHHYQPYDDFFHLVNLSGYPICYVDEIDHSSDNTYIVTPVNGEWNKGWKQTKARIIHWDLEWRDKSDYPVIPGVAETWASDKWYAGEVGARYVVLGSHEGLYKAALLHLAPFDVVAMMYRTNRRASILDRLENEGVTVAPNAWGRDRAALLGDGKLMLHLHQWDNVQTIAPLRFALAAAYKLPLISETCKDYGVFGYGHLLRSDYMHMIDFVKVWLKPENKNILADMGHSLHRLLCHDIPFRKAVEYAI